MSRAGYRQASPIIDGMLDGSEGGPFNSEEIKMALRMHMRKKARAYLKKVLPTQYPGKRVPFEMINVQEKQANEEGH